MIMQKNKSNGVSMGPSHWRIIDRWAEAAQATRSYIFQNMVEHLASHKFEKVGDFWWTWRERNDESRKDQSK